MKIKHISALIVLVLIALTSVSTVSATDQYDMTVSYNKKGKIVTFTLIPTDIGEYEITDVDLGSLQMTLYDSKDNTIVLDVWNFDDVNVDIAADQITIDVVWQNVAPHVIAGNIVGDLGTEGDTFLAAGIAWGWGGFHK
jgi:hypothetical protein